MDRFVDRADKSTIEGVVRTWAELAAWQRARSCAWCPSWWINSDLADIYVTPSKQGQPRGQAPCVGPNMTASWKTRWSWCTPGRCKLVGVAWLKQAGC